MTNYLTKLVALWVAPAIALAHPGHFDNSPLAHSVSHGLFYLLAVLALYLVAKRHGGRLLRHIARKR
jgi:hypothetical protein